MRLDQALVERGFCESREKAKRSVMAGQVRVNGHPAKKSSDSIRETDAIELTGVEKYVSRGGHKLEHALKHFALDVAGLVAVDLGASTGGFTDCLLQAGVAKVFAVDVGQGQLAWKLRQDARVVVMERTNARNLTPASFAGKVASAILADVEPGILPGGRNASSGAVQEKPGAPGATSANPGGKMPPSTSGQRPDATFQPFDLAVIDCSFISLTKILPAALGLVRAGGRIVALIKPQFEAGKAEVDKGAGVITDPAVHQRVIRELQEFVSGIDGARWVGVTESPLLGPAGNKEFLVLIEKNP